MQSSFPSEKARRWSQRFRHLPAHRVGLPVMVAVLSAFLLAGLTGCTTSGFPISGGSTPPPSGYQYLTGNWVFQTTSTAGTAPFTSLAGFIDEEDDDPGVNDTVTAALQAQPATCYLGADIIPLQGTLQATTLGIRSFDVNGQYLNINATKNTAATQLTGTYSVSGGCANGASGTLVGTRYDILNGTFTGSPSGNASESMQLTLSQNALGTGAGVFFVSGSATFTGFSCFASGTMANTSGSIIGNSVQLDFTTNDPNGSQVLITGTINQTATTLTATSLTVQGGDCAGSLGGATFNQQ